MKNTLRSTMVTALVMAASVLAGCASGPQVHSVDAKVIEQREKPKYCGGTPKLECSKSGYLVTVGYIHPVTRSYKMTTVPMDSYTRAEYISIQVR